MIEIFTSKSGMKHARRKLLLLAKKQPSFILARTEDVQIFVWFWQYSCFCLSSDMITEWSCVCLDLSWSHGSLEWHWCPVKLLMFNRRAPWPRWVSGQLELTWGLTDSIRLALTGGGCFYLSYYELSQKCY